MLMGLKLQRIPFVCNREPGRNKACIFNDYFRSGGFPEGASVCRKTGLSDKCLPKDIFREILLQDIPSKILLLYASFSQIGRKYKANWFRLLV